MFTGIVEHVGTIESLERSDAGARIRVNAGPMVNGLAKSASIAVNGCCLTAVDISRDAFAADLSRFRTWLNAAERFSHSRLFSSFSTAGKICR